MSDLFTANKQSLNSSGALRRRILVGVVSAFVLLGLALVVPAASATPLACWLQGSLTIGATPLCPTMSVINDEMSSSDLVEPWRLARTNPAGACGVNNHCPGSLGDTPSHYDLHQFINNSAFSQCVTVTLNPGSCYPSTILHSTAYLGTFDPTNPCIGYLADIGNSPEVSTSYSFNVPPGQFFSVVVNEIVFTSICSTYTLSVSSGTCPASGDWYQIYFPAVYR